MEAIYTIWLRNVKRYVRSKSRIVGSLGMPFFFLLILGFGLDNALAIPNVENYLSFIAPGIVAMTILFASMFSGIQVVWDKQFGFLKETLVAPISRLEIMIGQTLGGATIALIQGGLIFVISLGLGVSIGNVGGFLLAVVFMVLIGLCFTALGVAAASRMEDMQGFQFIINFGIFPLFFLSGALFPLEGLPSWLQGLTYIDPLTYGVQGIRYGVLGVADISPWISLIVLGAFTVAMLGFGAYMFRKIKL